MPWEFSLLSICDLVCRTHLSRCIDPEQAATEWEEVVRKMDLQKNQDFQLKRSEQQATGDDGEETVGVIRPLDAGQLAAEEGVKVYTIFAGPKVAYRQVGGINRAVEVDTSDLERIAELTDAMFYHAEDAAQLGEVYAEIESLERREREEERFAEHFDLYPRFLFPAVLLYLLAWLSLCTWARRLP